MTNEYILNGVVSRNRIALDIKYRKLKRAEIELLVADPMISSAFIGSRFNAKKAKKYWNKSYLDELSYAAIAESFNSDYLLYLDEVAEFVSKAPFKKIIVAGVIIALGILAGIIAYMSLPADENEHSEGTAEYVPYINTEDAE